VGLPRGVADAYVRVMEPYGTWILLILFATGMPGLVIRPITDLLTLLLFALFF
jgi:hypothetical protein